MADTVLCKICGKRRARRACPAVQGDICTICCGTEREVSLLCPLECEWLQEAHRHEKPVEPTGPFANEDIKISEEFLAEHEELLLYCTHSLVDAARKASGAIDTDVIAALEALIRTYRTLEAGLVYETRAANSIAASVQRSFSEALAAYQKTRAERGAISPVRDRDLLGVLVFLHRLGVTNQNGKPRGRMFMDMLRQISPHPGVEERAPSIIL